MIINEIKAQSKTKAITVLFDMDGTLTEYGIGEKPDIVANKPLFYYNKRPIKSTISIAKKLSQMKNVTVGILSNCYYREQREDKLRWLEKHLPFISKENIHIIVYSEETFEKEQKNYLKVNYIKSHIVNQKIYLIEDNHKIINATNEIIPNTAYHISTLLK